MTDCVHKQVDCGIDIVTDGEFSKPGFFTYIQERLEGYEARPNQKLICSSRRSQAFPEYYAEYFKEAMMGGTLIPIMPVVCVGPVKYRGEKLLQIDIENVKAAAKAAGVPTNHVFLPATAPPASASTSTTSPTRSTSMRSRPSWARSIARSRRRPPAPGRRSVPARHLLRAGPDDAQKKQRAEIYVEATNGALQGIPAEKVRFHTCYGINHGPRIYEAALSDIIHYVLKINAGSYSFEAANPRHEHEYHLFEHVKVPDGKVLCPGVITHASNIVEHPELIAERIMRFAKLVGRENVMAGADCGFSSQALYQHRSARHRGLGEVQGDAQGADIATKKLWS